MPPAEQLSSWLQVFFWIVGSGGAVVGLMLGVKALRKADAAPLPQPLKVQAHVEFITKPEHEALEERVDRLVNNTDERFAAMSRASSESRQKIYDLIREENRQTRTEMANQVAGLNKTVGDALIALGRAEGELRANRARKET